MKVSVKASHEQVVSKRYGRRERRSELWADFTFCTQRWNPLLDSIPSTSYPDFPPMMYKSRCSHWLRAFLEIPPSSDCDPTIPLIVAIR